MQIQQDSIQVVIRVKPNQSQSFLTLSESNIHLGNTTFTFDHIFLPEASQTQVYTQTGSKQIQHTLEGYNSCLFVYGQTGSGKTHTMIGQNNGIVQQSLQHLFTRIADNMIDQYQVTCSYFEIYNEQIFDLLDTVKDKKLSVRQDIKKGVFIEGLMESQITSMSEGISLLNQGIRTRHVGETMMNRQSSRSHAIYSLTVLSKIIENGNSIHKKSKIHFVDLAGSQRQKSTAAIGDRLKQASNINRSLTTLGMVINCLSGDTKQHVPFRNSKLTFVLRDSLGGNSKTFLIATIADTQSSIQETLSTLKFAQRAKLVKLNALINQESLSLNVDVLKSQIRRLKDQLARVKDQLQQQKQNKSSTPYNNVIVSSYSKSIQGFNDKINCLLDLIPKVLDKQPVQNNVQDYLKNNSEMLSQMSSSLSRLAQLKNEVRAKASIQKLRLSQLQPHRPSVGKLIIRKDKQDQTSKLSNEVKQSKQQVQILLKQQEQVRVQTEKVFKQKVQQHNALLYKYQSLQNKAFEIQESNSNLLLQLGLVKQKLRILETQTQYDKIKIEDYKNELDLLQTQKQNLTKHIQQLQDTMSKNNKTHHHELEQILSKLNQKEKQFNQTVNQLNHQHITKDNELQHTITSYEQRIQRVSQQFIQTRDHNFSLQTQIVSLQSQIFILSKDNQTLKQQNVTYQKTNKLLVQKISIIQLQVNQFKIEQQKRFHYLQQQKVKHSQQIKQLERRFSNDPSQFHQNQKLKQKCNELIVQNYKLKNKVQQVFDSAQITNKLQYYEEKFNLMKIEYNKSLETIRTLKQRQITVKEQNMKLINTIKTLEVQKQLRTDCINNEIKQKSQKIQINQNSSKNILVSCTKSEQLKRVISKLDLSALTPSKKNYDIQDLLDILQQTLKNKQIKSKKQFKFKQQHSIIKQNSYLKQRIRHIEQPTYATKTPIKKQRTH